MIPAHLLSDVPLGSELCEVRGPDRAAGVYTLCLSPSPSCSTCPSFPVTIPATLRHLCPSAEPTSPSPLPPSCQPHPAPSIRIVSSTTSRCSKQDCRASSPRIQGLGCYRQHPVDNRDNRCVSVSAHRWAHRQNITARHAVFSV